MEWDENSVLNEDFFRKQQKGVKKIASADGELLVF